MKGWRARIMLSIAVCCGAVASDFGRSRPAVAADYLQIGLGVLGVSVPIDALETFAETGKIPDELDAYVNYLPPEARSQFRDVLTRQFQVSPVAVSQLTYSSIGEDFLARLGKVITTPSGINGGQALRAALILAASDPEGLSILGILKAFPTAGIHIETGELLALQREVTAYFRYRDAILMEVTEASSDDATNDADIAGEPELAGQSNLPDLSQQGSFEFEKTTVELQNQYPGIPANTPRTFGVDLYLPQAVSGQQTPLIVISHGLGADKAGFSGMASHLASYGFAVAVPEHPGSDAGYRQELLATLMYEGIDPFEFVYRPWDVKTVLNFLSSDPTYSQRLNTQEVGVIGHSFGGYTVLTLAGAPLHQSRLQARCAPVEYLLNLSTLLQCRATELPPGDYDLSDERVAAVIAYSPVTSVLFGPEGLGQIEIPTLLVTGTNDFIAPAVPEQIHPFVWLENSQKYLAIVSSASHLSFTGEIEFPAQIESQPQVAELLTGPDPSLSTGYAYALNAAFMKTYVSDRASYEQFLTPGYADFLSESPIRLSLISQLSEDELSAAYEGGTPPIPVYPQPIPLNHHGSGPSD